MYLSFNIIANLILYIFIIIFLIYLNPQTLAPQIKHTKHPGFPKRDEILIDPRYK